MSDVTDAAVGATTGLLALGIMAGVAGQAMRNFPGERRRKKKRGKLKPFWK